MATTDDPVANVQRFIASLTTANGSLEQITQHLQVTSRDLAQLEDEAHSHGGNLNEDLDHFRSRLEAAEQGLRQAIDELTHTATQSRQTLAESEGQLEQAGGAVEEKAHGVSAHVEEEQSRLTDQGFTVLGHTLEEAEHQLDSEGRESDQAFNELKGVVHDLEAEAQAAWEAAHSAFEHASSEMSHEEATLTAQTSEAHQALDSEASELDSACHSLEGEIGTIYDTFTAGVETAGGELGEAAQSLIQEAVGFVQAGGQSRLEEPAETLEEGALGPLAEEYAALGSALHVATATAADLEPLTDELVKCKAVVGQVDKLLNAMAE
jgi:ABC-type transporter Mla subunit MlaD